MNEPAECFPVGEFIRDELKTRGWTMLEKIFLHDI